MTLGLIRVTYTEDERKVVLLFRPLVLLRFRAPEYDLSRDRGVVRWRIEDGLLVSPRGRGGNGYLEIDVRRLPSEQDGRGTVHVEVEVASFYPAIATWLTKFVYSHTQSRIHVLVTHGFLRSLARLDLEESAVGRFSEQQRGVRREKDGALTVGDTPWAVVAALAAAAAACVVAVALWLTRDSPSDSPSAPQLLAVVPGVDPAHRARARAHDQRLGRGAARALVAHALEHVAVGDAGGGEEASSPRTRSSWVSTRARS